MSKVKHQGFSSISSLYSPLINSSSKQIHIFICIHTSIWNLQQYLFWYHQYVISTSSLCGPAVLTEFPYLCILGSNLSVHPCHSRGVLSTLPSIYSELFLNQEIFLWNLPYGRTTKFNFFQVLSFLALHFLTIISRLKFVSSRSENT